MSEHAISELKEITGLCIELRTRLAAAEKQIEQLMADNLSLRCCGNCSHHGGDGACFNDDNNHMVDCANNNYVLWEKK